MSIAADDFERAEALFPQLRAPAPPVEPVPHPAGRYYVGAPTSEMQLDGFVDPAVEFRRVARDFTLRCPAVSAGRLVPIVCDGVCLEPIVHDGDLLHFDPALPATHGDVVLTGWHPDELAAAYSRPVSNLLTKLLLHAFGHVLLVCRDGARPLGRNRILGVLRLVVRGGHPLTYLGDDHHA